MLNACGQETTSGITLTWAPKIAGPYVEIGAVDSMPELSPTAETGECSDPYGAGTAGWKQFFKTMIFDGGEPSFTVNWTSGNAEHEKLEAAFTSPAKFFFRINYSDVAATKRTFPALVTNISHPLPGGGEKVQLTVQTKVSGAIVKTDASS